MKTATETEKAKLEQQLANKNAQIAAKNAQQAQTTQELAQLQAEQAAQLQVAQANLATALAQKDAQAAAAAQAALTQLEAQKASANLAAQKAQANLAAQKASANLEAAQLQAKQQAELQAAQQVIAELHAAQSLAATQLEAAKQQKDAEKAQELATLQSSLDAKVAQLDAAVAQAAQAAQQLEAEKILATTQIEAARSEAAQATQAELEKERVEIAVLKTKMQKEEEEKEKVLQELIKAQKNLEDKQAESQQLVAQAVRAEAEKDAFETSYQTQLEQLELTKSELNRLQQQQVNRSEVTSKLNEIKLQTNQLSEMKARISNANAKLEEYIKSLQEKQIETDQAKKDKQKLKSELEETKETVDKLKAEITTRNSNRANIAKLQAEISNRDKQISALNTQLDKMKAELDKMKAEKESYASQVEKLEAEKLEAEKQTPSSPISPKEKNLSSFDLTIFCENLQKTLDPRVVERLAADYQIGFGKNKMFKEASFDYANVCVACAHVLSIVIDFINMRVDPNPKNPFQRNNNELPAFFDFAMAPQMGPTKYQTSLYMKSILFSTKLSDKKNDKEWTGSTKSLKHDGHSKIPVISWSDKLKFKSESDKYSDKYNTRLAPGPQGIFGRIFPKTPKGGLLPLQIQNPSNPISLGIQIMGPALALPAPKGVTTTKGQTTLSDDVLDIANKLLDGKTSANYTDILNFLNKNYKYIVEQLEKESEKESDKSAVERKKNIYNKFRQLALTRELAYLVRVFDTRDFLTDTADAPHSGNLETQEMINLVQHMYNRSRVEKDGRHNMLRFKAHKDVEEMKEKGINIESSSPKDESYRDFDMLTSKAIKEGAADEAAQLLKNTGDMEADELDNTEMDRVMGLIEGMSIHPRIPPGFVEKKTEGEGSETGKSQTESLISGALTDLAGANQAGANQAGKKPV